MKNGTLALSGPRQPNGHGAEDPTKPTWRTRARAWIFGYGDELLLGKSGLGIPILQASADRHFYALERFFPRGTPIPSGESEGVSRQAADCTEFHLCFELSHTDLVSDLRKTRNAGCLPRPAFWVYPIGDGGTGDAYRVAYAMRAGVSGLDALVLRDKLSHPSRAILFLAIRSHRMRVLEQGLEGGRF